MKKRWSLLLVLALFLSACGQADPPPQPIPEPVVPPASVAQPAKPEPSTTSPPPPTVAVPEPSAPVPPEPFSPSATEASWWLTELTDRPLFVPPDSRTNAAVYLYDNVNKLAYGSNRAGVAVLSKKELGYDFSLITDSATEAKELGEPLEGSPFFEILAHDDTKYTGRLYQDGILLSKALPGQSDSLSVKLWLNPDDYKALQKSMTALQNDPDVPAVPAWLRMARVSRCQSITVTSQDKKTSHTFLGKISWPVDDIFDMLCIPTAPKSSVKVSPDAALADAATVEIHFVNDVVYKVQTDDKVLIVSSSDTDYALQYSCIPGWRIVQTLDGFSRNEMNPST